ncbi:hypothetical protein VDGD_21740 [Verticillium dahliae]|nr:hypothetical protein VDGD_21740 [Verticillium dahliae]
MLTRCKDPLQRRQGAEGLAAHTDEAVGHLQKGFGKGTIQIQVSRQVIRQLKRG